MLRFYFVKLMRIAMLLRGTKAHMLPASSKSADTLQNSKEMLKRTNDFSLYP
jgi:hypothetical protein